MAETRRREGAKGREGRGEGGFFEARSGIVGMRGDGCGDDLVEELAFRTIGAAIEVHKVLGPGLPETVYERGLCHELNLRQIPHERQAVVPVVYKGEPVGEGHVDVLVAGRLVVELKVTERLMPIHSVQALSYLCALSLPLGLVINFNVPVLHDGIRRVINTARR